MKSDRQRKRIQIGRPCIKLYHKNPAKSLLPETNPETQTAPYVFPVFQIGEGKFRRNSTHLKPPQNISQRKHFTEERIISSVPASSTAFESPSWMLPA